MKNKKGYLFGILIVCLTLFLLTIPITVAIGKYQVCKLYFSEMTTYVCLFTNLPPYMGVKK